MRTIFVFITFLVIIGSTKSQIPTGYYSTAEGLTEDNLKTALYNIIKGHTEYPYTSDNTDVWDILKESDKDTINPDNVILFYTGWTVDAAQEYNNGSGWSREHVWAKSRGDFGTTMGSGTDAHHLRPADVSVNSARNNRWFDNCTEQYIDGDGPTDSYTSSTSWVWQPRDEVKGDAARMIFYMATRYEGKNGEPDLEVIDYLPADDYTNEPIHAKLSALLQWHDQDPVDDYERNRNEVIYSYQGNRNPYIDHPEYVSSIWGNTISICDIEDKFQVLIYPNPANGYVTIDKPENYTTRIYSNTGKLLKNTRDNSIGLNSINPGCYIVSIFDPLGREYLYQKLIVR